MKQISPYKYISGYQKMTSIDDSPGNIIIKYHDRWRGNYYLTEELTFSPHRGHAARFYMLKSEDTEIVNGDRVSFNLGAKRLVVDHDHLRLINREDLLLHGQQSKITSFVVMDGSDSVESIKYETPMYIISDSQSKMALKYDWGMEIIPETTCSESTTQPQMRPKLINAHYGDVSQVTQFQFTLEKWTSQILTTEDVRSATASPQIPKTQQFEGYKGIVLIFLLLIILALGVVINQTNF